VPAQLAALGRPAEDRKAIATSSGEAMAVRSPAAAIEEEGAGRLRRRRWTDRDGRERDRLEVVADV